MTIDTGNQIYQSTVEPLKTKMLRRSSYAEAVGHKLKETTSHVFSRSTLEKRLPCITWMRNYNMECLMGDLVAGFTLGLLTIPQALAYGLVAGVTPNYGLYTAFMGCFVYLFLGTTKELNIGPTAVMSLITMNYTSQGGAEFAILISFVTGCLVILAAMVNLGFLINFISVPVISGFTSAAAITIASSQIKALLGLSLSTRGVVDTWTKVGQNIGLTRWEDVTLGLICSVILLSMKELKASEWKWVQRQSPITRTIIEKTAFFIGVGKNAIIVLIASIIAFCLDGPTQPFTLTGNVAAGIPDMSLPPFNPTVGNHTLTFMETIADVGAGVIVIPFIAMLDHIAIVSAFTNGKTFDATQEMIAIGLSNIFGSFFSSLPMTGSLSRAAVNQSSGVRTPAGGLITGVMVLLALEFLTPFFKFIPKTTLAAVIICAVVRMVNYEILFLLWRTRPRDILPLVATFCVCLFVGLEYGIVVGVCVNLSMLLFAIATPSCKVKQCVIEETGREYVQVMPSHGISYPSTVHVRTKLQKAGKNQAGGKKPVVMDCSLLNTADFTSAKGLKGTVEEFDRRGQPLVFMGLKPKVRRIIISMCDVLVCDNKEELEEVIQSVEGENKLLLPKGVTVEEKPSANLIDVSKFIDEDDEDDEVESPEEQLLAPMLINKEN